MADLYHVFCDLRPGMKDLEFINSVRAWLDHLKSQGTIQGYRTARRKLGLGIEGLGEFHIQIEVRDLAQLDEAFAKASARSDPAESLHYGVNHMVKNSRFALYRDFPDPNRQTGQERF